MGGIRNVEDTIMPIKDIDPIETAAREEDKRTNALSGVDLHPEQRASMAFTPITDRDLMNAHIEHDISKKG